MFITYSHQYVKIHGYFLSDICISCGQCPHVRGEKNSLLVGFEPPTLVVVPATLTIQTRPQTELVLLLLITTHPTKPPKESI